MTYSQAPELLTERLLLRPHRLSDFDDSLAMWSDPEVARFIGGKPSTRDEVWFRLLRYVGLWELLGYGYFVVTDRESGRFLGEVGVADFHRPLPPTFSDFPEAGWAFAPAAHGRGIATEAVQRLLAWCDERFERTVCMIDPQNAPSIRVAGKCGFAEYERAAYRDHETILFERRRSGQA